MKMLFPIENEDAIPIWKHQCLQCSCGS